MKRPIFIVGCLLITLCFFISCLSSCAMPTISKFTENDPNIEEIFRTSSSISLAWVYSEPGTLDYYKLYYKAHGSSNWIPLETIPSTAPVFAISYESLGKGSWDFGVSAVNALGTESDIHSSLDMNADPSTGWYLLWAR